MLRLRPLAVAVLGLSALPVSSLVLPRPCSAPRPSPPRATPPIPWRRPQAVEILQAPAAGGTVAGELLRGKPGLAAQSDGAWGQNPVLRGLKKESVVVMVNGVRMNSAQPQGAIASFLDLGLLERAEVVKGPGSVLYGSGAMGGVVNLITPDVRFHGRGEAWWPHRRALLERGSRGLRRRAADALEREQRAGAGRGRT